MPSFEYHEEMEGYEATMSDFVTQTRPGKREDGYHDLAPCPGSAARVPRVVYHEWVVLTHQKYK